MIISFFFFLVLSLKTALLIKINWRKDISLGAFCSFISEIRRRYICGFSAVSHLLHWNSKNRSVSKSKGRSLGASGLIGWLFSEWININIADFRWRLAIYYPSTPKIHWLFNSASVRKPSILTESSFNSDFYVLPVRLIIFSTTWSHKKAPRSTGPLKHVTFMPLCVYVLEFLGKLSLWWPNIISSVHYYNIKRKKHITATMNETEVFIFVINIFRHTLISFLHLLNEIILLF